MHIWLFTFFLTTASFYAAALKNALILDIVNVDKNANNCYLIGLFICTPQLFTQSLKKVMILDFKNLGKNSDYTYLEDSITEAVRNDLKAKFDFREMQRGDWHKLAEKNLFLWPEDNYTRSMVLWIGPMPKKSAYRLKLAPELS